MGKDSGMNTKYASDPQVHPELLESAESNEPKDAQEHRLVYCTV